MPGPLTPSRLGVVYNFEGELLHCAAIYDQDQFLNDLLTTGENGTVDSVDKFGRTPLHTAAFHGSIKCVKILLQKGGKMKYLWGHSKMISPRKCQILDPPSLISPLVSFFHYTPSPMLLGK